MSIDLRLDLPHTLLPLGEPARMGEHLYEPEQARENLAIATTMYREMGMTYWREKADAEMRDPG